ncbi:hypothetical protein [Nitratireductor sp. ZSWI3]|uniref:hypothetical protein n=1 Tax=Nitratireductor sp. ZSWI3 TaxID=2966359 RepID=UPI00214F67EF|nr:hypothetical protein [Nitratireductor sp. ZSWI3]MCR4268860.1 hypothetical protein [Nitratireductor sp. ZSWI3]
MKKTIHSLAAAAMLLLSGQQAAHARKYQCNFAPGSIGPIIEAPSLGTAHLLVYQQLVRLGLPASPATFGSIRCSRYRD